VLPDKSSLLLVLVSNGLTPLQLGPLILHCGAGLSLAGNQFSLNLGSTNIWTAHQYFNIGIGVTGNSVFTNIFLLAVPSLLVI
jgi:hypothetical protein